FYWNASMTWRAWLTALAVSGVVAALTLNCTTTDVPIICAAACLVLTRVIDVQTAFAGFANPALLAIAALFPVAAGITESGTGDIVTRIIFGSPQRLWMAVARIMTCTAFASAFINNTPIVAMLIP